MSLKFIFMLTRNDQTVKDAEEHLETVLNCGVKHIGFKDIGLSFEKLKPRFFNVLIASFLKVIVTPAIGLVLFKVLSIAPTDYLPGLILLSSPTATLSYIMAKEIGGDPDFAVAAISICTIISSLTYGLWLSIA